MTSHPGNTPVEIGSSSDRVDLLQGECLDTPCTNNNVQLAFVSHGYTGEESKPQGMSAAAPDSDKGGVMPSSVGAVGSDMTNNVGASTSRKVLCIDGDSGCEGVETGEWPFPRPLLHLPWEPGGRSTDDLDRRHIDLCYRDEKIFVLGCNVVQEVRSPSSSVLHYWGYSVEEVKQAQ